MIGDVYLHDALAAMLLSHTYVAYAHIAPAAIEDCPREKLYITMACANAA